MSAAQLVALRPESESSTQRGPVALIQIRKRPDRFEADTMVRESFGIVATGRFRIRQWDGSYHYYGEGTRSWPWAQIVEVRES